MTETNVQHSERVCLVMQSVWAVGKLYGPWDGSFGRCRAWDWKKDRWREAVLACFPADPSCRHLLPFCSVSVPTGGPQSRSRGTQIWGLSQERRRTRGQAWKPGERQLFHKDIFFCTGFERQAFYQHVLFFCFLCPFRLIILVGETAMSPCINLGLPCWGGED